MVENLLTQIIGGKINNISRVCDTCESEEKYRVFDDFQSFIMKN